MRELKRIDIKYLKKPYSKNLKEMIFLISVIVTFVLTILFGIKRQYAIENTKKYFLLIFIGGVIITPITGALQGTLYTHGFDILWWWYSVANFTVIIVTAVIVTGLMRLLKYLKKK